MDILSDAGVLVDPMDQNGPEGFIAISHLTVSSPSPNMHADILQLSSLSVRCRRLVRFTSACSGKW